MTPEMAGSGVVATRDVNCAHCHRAIQLQFLDGPNRDATKSEHQTWRCPYCRQGNEGAFSQPVKWIVKGHQADIERRNSSLIVLVVLSPLILAALYIVYALAISHGVE
jgi:hypothetical protein